MVVACVRSATYGVDFTAGNQQIRQEPSGLMISTIGHLLQLIQLVKLHQYTDELLLGVFVAGLSRVRTKAAGGFLEAALFDQPLVQVPAGGCVSVVGTSS